MTGRLAAALVALGMVLAASPASPARADGPSPTDLVDHALVRTLSASRRVARLLDDARRSGDVLRATCLDDALNRIDSQVRLLEDRADRIRRAEAAHDAASLSREARLLGYVLHLVPQTEHAADSCVGIVMDRTLVDADMPTDPAD